MELLVKMLFAPKNVSMANALHLMYVNATLHISAMSAMKHNVPLGMIVAATESVQGQKHVLVA